MRVFNSRNILFFRNRGATTSDKAFKSLSKRVNDSKLIINDIRSFLNYDSKDRSFEIWKKNNLQCPNHISFSLNEMNESIHMEKMINQFLEKYKITNSLIISDKNSKSKIIKSARNIPNIKIIEQEGANVYDLLKYKNVVFTTSSVKSLQERLQNEKI